MIIYVAHKANGEKVNIERAKKILCELQANDLDNTYICPLTALVHIWGTDISYQDEMELRLDLLSVSDVLLVASEITETVQREIDFANEIHMEVRWLE